MRTGLTQLIVPCELATISLQGVALQQGTIRAVWETHAPDNLKIVFVIKRVVFSMIVAEILT